MLSNGKGEVTEEFIRKKLESSGELPKIRAMIVDAALKSLLQDRDVSSSVFSPSPRLQAEKKSENGIQTLSVLVDYLEHMGLNYTLSVLKQEACLSECNLKGRKDVLSDLGLAEGVNPILTTLMESSSAKSEGNHGSTTATAAAASTTGAQKEEGEDTTYYISKWTGKTFYRTGEVSGQQVQLEYLTDCTVYILDPLDSITVDDCVGGTLVIAACEGSVFLRNCKNMTVHVACKQLRTRDCEHVSLHIFATTDPVVESSHHIDFVPFHLRLPQLITSFKAARLDPKTNRFVHVYDFTEDDQQLPKPHFTVTYQNHGLRMTDMCGEKGVPECPQEIEDLLAGRLAPAASSESGNNKSYNIKTGAKEWTGSNGSSGQESSKGAVGTESSSNTGSSASATPPSVKQDTAPSASGPQAAQQPVASAARDGQDDSYSSFDDDDESDSHSEKTEDDDSDGDDF
uniref:Uncharacterized protein TCIL3000_10_11680 n=1 Tax=Trypanosoma congolense (strain IL3000) TaxID=1068625 RepID=G0UYC0_TRYCI|nr:unnamed protein product [Trypanosoma congolense IL3000]